MATLRDRLQTLWNSTKAGKAKTRAILTFQDEQGEPFSPRQHYFQIVINEMFLANQREWFVTYAPVAFVVAQYLYGRSLETSPPWLGLAMLLREGVERTPQGTIVRNTPVTSLHPYQGGPMTLTIILNRVQQNNNADRVPQVLESVSGVVNPVAPAIPFATYLKIAGSVMDGVETLLGLPECEPILGYRFTVNPDIDQVLEPTYLALIDVPEKQVQAGQFRIQDERLHKGSEPYREHDFVLLKLAQGDGRSDERTLPFYPLWEQTRALALQSSNDHFWQEAKAHFNTLKREMINSPDLIRPDYTRLIKGYLAEMQGLRTEAVDESHLAREQGLSAEEAEMERITRELDELDEL